MQITQDAGGYRVGASYVRHPDRGAAEKAGQALQAGLFREAEGGAEHVGVMTDYAPLNQSRHQLEPGLDVVMGSAPGETRPNRIAYCFDAATWPVDRALEWLLTRTHGEVLRFQRAG